MAGDHGAFVTGGRIAVPPTGSGVLDGLTFAVKDNIDVAGCVSGAGNPDWRAGRPPAAQSAPCVQALLAAGAAMIGRTVCDELAFSLEGRNAFDGTPDNPVFPEGLAGGSSSGSAVAVAAGLADFALGTDTGGSVRVPAAFCGIFGFRPTHGRVPIEGVVPLAPSYDTVGWFARSAECLQRAGGVLLGAPLADARQVRLILAEDAFDVLSAADRAALLAAARRLGFAATSCLFEGHQELWRACYRVVQGNEIWQTHAAWIAQTAPRFAPDIAARFADAAAISPAEMGAMREVRQSIARHVTALVPEGTVLLLPSAPGPALRRDADAAAVGQFYAQALALSSAAGHAGLPQLSLPAAVTAQGWPLGLSAIGWAGGDAALLEWAANQARKQALLF